MKIFAENKMFPQIVICFIGKTNSSQEGIEALVCHFSHSFSKVALENFITIFPSPLHLHTRCPFTCCIFSTVFITSNIPRNLLFIVYHLLPHSLPTLIT